MTIQITRDPRGDGSPIIAFVGSDTNDQQAADKFSFVQTITPQVNLLNPTRVDIVDTEGTLSGGIPRYVLQNVEYDQWLDRDSNPFASALDVVSYIQTEVANAVSILTTRGATPVAITTSIDVSVNTQFEFDGSHEGGCGYFWDRNGFPPQVQVNPLDRRKISGIMTVTGTFAVQYEVANVNGITSSTVYINVL